MVSVLTEHFAMPYLRLNEWRRFQREGKRSILKLRLKQGLLLGVVLTISQIAIGLRSGTRNPTLGQILILIPLYTIAMCEFVLVLDFLVRWELLRRKFSAER